ncbi:hypothetical protein N185_10140 [Sinorhizobium sp. GW3]|nr:hypothetical protein N185_10140 [Sinorhizobium sp. GW3]
MTSLRRHTNIEKGRLRPSFFHPCLTSIKLDVMNMH